MEAGVAHLCGEMESSWAGNRSKLLVAEDVGSRGGIDFWKMLEGGAVESWGRLKCWWRWFCLVGIETTLKLGPLRAEIVEIPGVQIEQLKRMKYWTKRCIAWEARSNY